MTFVFSQCIEGLQYYSIPGETQTFAGAESQCALQGGQLAIPRSLNQFNTIGGQLGLSGLNNVWLGLIERVDSGLIGTDTERFLRVDGNRNSFTAEAGFATFPWQPGEPNDFGGGGENCVELTVSLSGLNDHLCDQLFGYLCERSCTGDCLAGLEYSVTAQELLNFDQSEALCAAQGGQMALPATEERLADLQTFLSSFNVGLGLLGLVDRTNSPVSGDTQRFLDQFGEPNGFTNREPFQFPWGGADPNGLAGENCVDFDVVGGVIRDNNCDIAQYNAVCEKRCGIVPQFAFDQCVDGVQLYFNPKQEAFDEALVDCRRVDPRGKLMIPTNQAKINRAGALMQPRGSFLAFVGLVNYAKVILDPALFLPIDTGIAIDFIASGNQPPWQVGQPDNSGGQGQFCVMIDFAGTEPNLIDIECSLAGFESVCERPCDPLNDSPVRFDECVDGTQFFFNPDLKIFDDAQASCQSLDSGANLAIPTTSTKLERMNLFLQLESVDPNHWVGFRTFGDPFDTTSYVTVEGNLNPFSSGPGGIFPWSSTQPDGSGTCGNLFSTGEIDDADCNSPFPSLCERYCGVQPQFVFDQCINNNQYYFNPELRTWDGAQADCRAIDPLGKLAIPTNSLTLSLINSFYQTHRTESRNAHIGLRDFLEVGGLDTGRFIPFEGDVNTFTSGASGVAPWLAGQPDDLGGNQDCVAIAFAEGLLIDEVCTSAEFSICQRPCVGGITITEAPTSSPTSNPTAIPTTNPTANPTTNPTANPTVNPTANPTTNPSSNPTTNPTANPTTNPTANPTANPTSNPTPTPTLSPTKAFVFGSCIEGFQYYSIPFDFRDFSSSEAQCALGGGQLAVPRSLRQFNIIRQELAISGSQLDTWLGLIEREDTGLLGTDTERFLRVDGGRNSFTAEAGFGNFPWLENAEPNDVEGIENCVHTASTANATLNDIDCTIVLAYLCERPCSGGCNEGLEYSIAAGELFNFDSASAFCEAQGGQLAIPSSKQRLDSIIGFSQPFNAGQVILGLNDPVGTGGAAVTNRFIGVDGQPNGFTSRAPFVAPWDVNEPLDEGGIEDCVDIVQGTSVLRDSVCEDNVYTSVCEKSCRTTPQFVFGECVDGLQLYFNREGKTFDEAVVDCKNIDSQGTLAVPRNEVQLNKTRDFIAQQSLVGDFRFLGFRNFDEVGLNASLFVALSGEPLDFINVGNQFPWSDIEPNNAGGDEFCGTIDSRDGLLNDFPCTAVIQSVCERPCVVGVASQFKFDECVDGTQLFFNPELRTFDQAQASCQSFDSRANLAIPTTSTKFARMQTFQIQEAAPLDNWIGLERDFNISTPGTEDFLTADGNINPFTSGVLGQFPWAGSQPDNLGGIQSCGTMFNPVTSSSLLDDNQCDVNLPSMCERYCGVRPSFVFDECVNGIELYFNPELRTWDGAQADCRAIDPLGKLAIPTDRFTQQRISALFETHRTESQNAFLGLRDFLEVGGVGGDRFVPVEGVSNPFTSGFSEAFNQGDIGDDGSNNEHCVVMLFGQGLLGDNLCTEQRFSVCQRPCVGGINLTLSPTETPTRQPTGAPTNTPTSGPTNSPTNLPTASPTPRRSTCSRRTFGITNPQPFF